MMNTNETTAASETAGLPPTMRAIVQYRYGTPDQLNVEEIDLPAAPGTGEVLLRVRAAGLDRGTWHQMTGQPYVARLDMGLRRPRNPVPGLDVAGTVVAVGPGVTRFALGDHVFGVARGSFAQYALARADRLAQQPTSLTADQAAVIGVSGCAALHALQDAGRVQPGQHVLILGASGGVGTYAVQIAKALGAEVTGVCSGAKADLVRSLGADHVIDYQQQDPTDGATQYDLIVDIGGNRSLPRLRRSLTPAGTLAIVGGENGGKWTGGIGRQLRAAMLSPLLRQRLVMVVSKEQAPDLEALATMIEAGHVRPHLDSVVPLPEAADAMRRLEGGEVRGKIAISVSAA